MLSQTACPDLSGKSRLSARLVSDESERAARASFAGNNFSVLCIAFLLFQITTFAQISFIDHIIATDAEGAVSVYAIDMDGDQDMDVLSASSGDDKIAWYENDGSQNFTPHDISITADIAQSVYAIDVDSDGDIDVLSASFLDNKIAWYENDGNENFTSYTITSIA